MGKRKGERPGFERDRKKDRGGRKRETGIGEREREREREREKRERERESETDVVEREISSCKNKEYKKAKSFIWMF